MLRNIKDAFLYVVAPLAFIAGYIYYLLGRNEALERRVEQAERDQRIKDLVREAREFENEAKKAIDSYESTKRAYMDEHKQGGDDVPGRD